MAFHHLYLGGGETAAGKLFPQNAAGLVDNGCSNGCPPGFNGNSELTTAVLDDVWTEAAGHKVHTDFGLSRTLSFGGTPGANLDYALDGDCLKPVTDACGFQPGLAEYLACNPIAEGDTIYPVVLPPEVFVRGIWWKVNVPQPNVVLTLSSVRGDLIDGVGETDEITINGSVVDSGYIAVNKYIKVADALQLVGTDIPAAGLIGCITISALVVHPDTGN